MGPLHHIVMVKDDSVKCKLCEHLFEHRYLQYIEIRSDCLGDNSSNFQLQYQISVYQISCCDQERVTQILAFQ